MRLLNAVQGKSGEALSSAILAYLLIRSPDARRVFLGFVSTVANLPPPTGGQRFSVEMEVETEFRATEGADVESGKIDLLIESDNYVIGVENKLFAPFQPNQPHKYWQHVEQAAAILNHRYSINGRDSRRFHPKLLVLAPPRRQRDLAEHENISFVSWEGMLDALSKVKTGDSVTSEIIQELDEFVRPQLNFFENFRDKLPRLRLPIGDYANETQVQLIGALWEIFRPAALFADIGFHPRRTINSWYGAHFLPRAGAGMGWYGFQNLPVGNGKMKAFFVIGLHASVFETLPFAFENVPNVEGWNHDTWTTWKLNLEHLQDENAWRDAVKPLHEFIAKLRHEDRVALGYTS